MPFLYIYVLNIKILELQVCCDKTISDLMYSKKPGLTFKLHLLADRGSLLHAEAVRGCKKKGALRQEVFRVRYVTLAFSALHHSVNLFLPHV